MPYSFNEIIEDDKRIANQQINTIVCENQDVLKKKDRNGALPIFSCLLHSEHLEDETFKLMIDGYSGCLKTWHKGNLPLHVALEQNIENSNFDSTEPIKHRSSDEIIEYMVNLWPKALQTPNNMSVFPLSMAIHSGVSEALISSFIDLWPDALRMIDDDSSLPIHDALANMVSPTLITKMLDIFPER